MEARRALAGERSQAFWLSLPTATATMGPLAHPIGAGAGPSLEENERRLVRIPGGKRTSPELEERCG